MFRSLKMMSFSALLMLLFLCLPHFSSAQPPGDDCFGSDPMDECPIDGGVGALLVIGVGYGVKKVRESRSKSINKLH